MATGLRTGLDDKFYINSGNYAVPTWVEVQLVADLNVDLTKELAEIKYRGSRWKKTLPSHKALALSFKMLGDTSDTNYATVRDAFINDTMLDVAVADAAIATSGTEYLRFPVYLDKFTRDQPLNGANVSDVGGQLAYDSHDPGFTTAS